MSKLSGLHRGTRTIVNVNTNVSASDPYGAAMCDGCGFWVENRALRRRMAYRGGSAPVWDGFWVCGVCDDLPNAQFAKPKTYRDPVALPHPRIDSAMTIPGSNNSDSGYGYLVDEKGDYICSSPNLDFGLRPITTATGG